jgi:hypothetical protein
LTRPCVVHRESARYLWLLPRGETSPREQLDYAPVTTASVALSFGSVSAPPLNGGQKDMPQLPQVAGAF